MTNTVNQTKSRTFYGISSKDFVVLAQATNDVLKLGQMLTFAKERVEKLKTTHPSRVKRWEKVTQAVAERLGNLSGAIISQPQQTGNITYTGAPASKAKKVAKKTQVTAKIEDPISAALSASGMTREALLIALARNA